MSFRQGQGLKPIKLGDAGKVVSNVKLQDFESERPPRPRRNIIIVVAATLVLAALAGGGVAVALLNNADSSELGEATAFPTAIPSPLPTTLSPTTKYPTVSPTLYPTRSPTPPTTQAPSSPPSSAAPTSSLPCEDPDAACGCDLVQSILIDILFVVDESGSIRPVDFGRQKTAVINFINNTRVIGELGSRYGWMEFNSVVDTAGLIDLTDFTNKQALMNAIAAKTLATGGTNQALALEVALQYFQKPENSFRNGSQRVVIMFTDGQPCVTGGCPQSELAQLSPVDELKDLALYFQNSNPVQPFTFFYMPIEPDPNCWQCQPVDPDLFDGDNGLVEGETFIKFAPLEFSELDNKLNTELTIPLGPCITPPPTLTG